MTRNLLISACASLHCVSVCGGAIPARGEVFGVWRVTRDSASKLPVAQVRITAHN